MKLVKLDAKQSVNIADGQYFGKIENGVVSIIDNKISNANFLVEKNINVEKCIVSITKSKASIGYWS